jgi:predicted phage terminase large subunit-like protein
MDTYMAHIDSLFPPAPPAPIKRSLTGVALQDALIRNDLMAVIRMTFTALNPGTPFSDNWHINAIAWHLDLVRRGKIKRLIIAMPPRSLKSISVSVAFPAFLHGLDPAKNIVCVSYGQDLAAKWQNDYRTVLGAPWYQRAFPGTRIGGKDAENEVLLTGRGARLATSIGGTLTGRGADIVIIDDPLKPNDAMSAPKRSAVNDWYRSTLVSRLNNKAEGAIVIVMQRLHSDDLVGHLLKTSGEDWTVLNLPAIAPADASIPIGKNRVYNRKADEVLHEARESRVILGSVERDLGAERFAAQYLQCPISPGGLRFRRAWFRYYDELPPKDGQTEIFQSWDTASKTGLSNDYSVCTTWRLSGGKYFLLDVYRAKLEFPDLKAKAIALYRAWRPNGVLIEDANVGTGLIAELRGEGISAIGVIASQSKDERAYFQTAKFQAEQVWFPKSAPWLSQFETELLEFPGGLHDDQVDSTVQMLGHQIQRVVFRWVKF